MKKLLFLALLLVTITSANAQTGYVSTSISFPNTADIKNNAYPTIEMGMMEKNVTFGICLGVNSFNSDRFFMEAKTTAYFPIGAVKGFGLLGVGVNSLNTHLFIEYGTGLSFSLNKTFDLSFAVSNWDGTTYLTPCITYNFGSQ